MLVNISYFIHTSIILNCCILLLCFICITAVPKSSTHGSGPHGARFCTNLEQKDGSCTKTAQQVDHRKRQVSWCLARRKKNLAQSLQPIQTTIRAEKSTPATGLYTQQINGDIWVSLRGVCLQSLKAIEWMSHSPTRGSIFFSKKKDTRLTRGRQEADRMRRLQLWLRPQTRISMIPAQEQSRKCFLSLGKFRRFEAFSHPKVEMKNQNLENYPKFYSDPFLLVPFQFWQ